MSTKDTKSERRTITVTEAGQMLGVSRGAAYEAARLGQIPTIRIGRRLLVPLVPFDRLLGKSEGAGSEADAA